MIKYREVQGTLKLVRDREVFELRGFELSRFYCTSAYDCENKKSKLSALIFTQDLF